MKDRDTYYEAIKGQDVKVGDLLGRGTTFLRVTGFTKAQIRCVEIERDLTTPRKYNPVCNVTKDKGTWGGGIRIGDNCYSIYEPITEDEARERLAKDDEAKAKKHKEQEERNARQDAVVAARREHMAPDYEKRTLLDERLGVWGMSTTNDAGKPVFITWTKENKEGYDFRSGYGPSVSMSFAFWYAAAWNDEVRGPSSTSDYGADELSVLASRDYS
jgi:hypothetical protein